MIRASTGGSASAYACGSLQHADVAIIAQPFEEEQQPRSVVAKFRRGGIGRADQLSPWVNFSRAAAALRLCVQVLQAGHHKSLRPKLVTLCLQLAPP